MYHQSSVEIFLVDQRVHPGVIGQIQARMEEVADEDGIFTADRLDYIMGEELAEAYRQACDENPGLMLAVQQPTEVPHHSRKGLGTYQASSYTSKSQLVTDWRDVLPKVKDPDSDCTDCD